MFYVIGSGPAAISAAVALTERGLPVTILDAGRTLEKDKQEVLDRLGRPERLYRDQYFSVYRLRP